MENNKLEAAILQVSTEERAINYQWEKNADKLDKNIKIVCMDKIQEMKDDGWSFKTSMPLCEGMTLALHPFVNKCYIDINSAEDIIFKDKLDSLGKVSKLLGVKIFEAKAIFIEEQNCEFGVSGNIKYKVVDVDASYRKKEEEKYAKTYSRKETFSGEFTQMGYEKAKQLIKQYRLEDLDYIVEQRNPEDGNKLSAQEVKIDLAGELNSLKDCAFSLNILKGVFGLNANVERTISTRKKVILETKLIF